MGFYPADYLMGRELLQSPHKYTSQVSSSFLELTRYYPLFRAAIPLSWTDPHVLLSRLPLPSRS